MDGNNIFLGFVILLVGVVLMLIGMRKRGAALKQILNAAAK